MIFFFRAVVIKLSLLLVFFLQGSPAEGSVIPKASPRKSSI